jgi:membrane-associated protein
MAGPDRPLPHLELFVLGIVALSLVPVAVEVGRGRQQSRRPV